MSSAQIVSATAVQPVTGSVSGKSVLPPVLYPHMSPLRAQYSAYTSSGVSYLLQVACTLHGVAGVCRGEYGLLCALLG